MRVLAAPDKFRGTASAVEVVEAIAAACEDVGVGYDCAPMADGGEGTLASLGGANRSTTVSGPLGKSVTARWQLSGTNAVVEMAEASGLAVVGGIAANDPIAASTIGTGELIAEAVRAGARRVLVAVGGAATTDGGLGALRAMPSQAEMHGVDLVAACDVHTAFTDAATVFGPQKGATPAQVKQLRQRLTRLAQTYLIDHGVDVSSLVGAGAGGGLAGGLAARGAVLAAGFGIVAEEIDLAARMKDTDLVITGEGRLDVTSLDGKVVGGVARLATEAGVPTLAVVGASDCSVTLPTGLDVIDLSARFGSSAATADVCTYVRSTVREALEYRAHPTSRRSTPTAEHQHRPRHPY